MGVELDMAEVEKAHQLYKQHGLGTRDVAMADVTTRPGLGATLSEQAKAWTREACEVGTRQLGHR
ncbi:MAG: hypothetical protein H7Z42_20630 [Roseiflexaceae bacterium]|nr:hypothetical protein [Roseiflexaceae bacterium]